MGAADAIGTRVGGVIRGVHLLAIAAIVLAGISLRATELYASRYQTLPVLDWLDSRPPLAESDAVPAANDLVRGFSRVMPLLVIRDDARPRTPVFGPPAVVQRTVGGVRDASRIELGTPGQFASDQVPVRARMDVIVFNRVQRAAAWSDLMGREMDIKDPDSGEFQSRTAGPDDPDGVWVVAPWRTGGIAATVAGRRGAVGFVVQVSMPRELNGDRLDTIARCEAIAREAAAEWTAWLATQVNA
jgi:hypothetical protein